MKKVLLYTSSQMKNTSETGGVKRFKELINGLPNYCDFTLISGDEEYDVPDGGHHYSMHHNFIANKEYKYAIHNYKYLKQIKRNDYDALLVFDVPPAFWLTVFHMPKIILMVRKDYIGYERVLANNNQKHRIVNLLSLFLKYIAESVVVFDAFSIIVQCEYDKKRLKKRHPLMAHIIEKKTKVQINNVNPSWLSEDKSIARPIKSEIHSIGSINEFNDCRKGCDIFLEAVRELTINGYKIEAYIAGNGKQYQYYKDLYSDYSNIHFVGYIDNPKAFLQSVDLAVVPSRADSCPNTIMEAIQLGIPVIASNVGGIPEILADSNALFDPSVEALIDCIKDCLNNSEKVSNIALKQKLRKQQLTFNWPESIINALFT